MFEIGQKVVCINDRDFPTQLLGTYYMAFPRKDHVYTVRDIVRGHTGNGVENICTVLLKEITNYLNPLLENGYKPSRFRPVDEEEFIDEINVEITDEIYV